MRAGHCVACDAPVWRFVTYTDARTTQDVTVPLWPDPASKYAVFANGPDSIIPGVPYCDACCPDLGGPAPEAVRAQQPAATACIEVETAHARHPHWYCDRFGRWLADWLRDHAQLDEAQRGALVALWTLDRG